MKCAGCGEEVGNLYCTKCRAKLEKKYRVTGFLRRLFARVFRKKLRLIPLILYDVENKQYVFGCTVKGCPCNNGTGLCATKHKQLPIPLLHEFDGDNCIRQVCG